jgi:peptidoglycan hydrolase-like protein with peptidoglycan-binding domain
VNNSASRAFIAEPTGEKVMRISKLAGAAMALGAMVAAPGRAADIAMVIGNGGGDGGGDGQRQAVSTLTDVLASHGYEVLVREQADRSQMEEVLGEVEGRIGETDRLLLVFAGAALTQGERTWLVPAGFDGRGRVAAEFGAVRLDLLLDLAARLPGRAAVAVAAIAVEPEDAGDVLRPGIADTMPPQGVLFISGEAEAVMDALIADLLGEAETAAEALEGIGDAVSVAGFLSPDTGFTGQVAPAPARPEPQPEAPRVSAAEAAEEDLGLSQADRRRVQEQLTVLGFNPRGIDGIFGAGTRGALGEWQAGEGLSPTGFLTAEQRRLLGAQAEARSAELAAAAELARRQEEEADAAFWRTTGQNGSEADLRAYLDRYPDGIYAPEARAALDRIEAASAEAAAEEDRAAFDRATGRDTAGAYRTYLEQYPEGAFAGRARARIDALQEAPERAARDAEAAAEEEALGLNRGSRALIEGQLAAAGYETGEADGSFDADTRRALREFQTRQGLPVTGHVDQATIQALIVATLGLR